MLDISKENQDRMSGNDNTDFLEDDNLVYSTTGIDHNKVLLIVGKILKKQNFRKFLSLTTDECIAIGWKQSKVLNNTVFRTDIASNVTFIEFGTVSIFDNNIILVSLLSEKNAQSVNIEITKESISCKVYDATEFIKNVSDPTKIKSFKNIPTFPELLELQKELV